jgi:hypothetical protein
LFSNELLSEPSEEELLDLFPGFLKGLSDDLPLPFPEFDFPDEFDRAPLRPSDDRPDVLPLGIWLF